MQPINGCQRIMKLLIANWKMNPANLEEALDLFDFYLSEISKYKNIQLVVCPPFVYLEELAKRVPATSYQLPAISLGSQDLFWEKSGPYTGEVSVDMLKNFGVTHVLIGHSDRRYQIGSPSTTLGQPKVVVGETDEVINKKIKAALAADITPVLLVGERNRDDNRQSVLEQQLSADLVGLTADEVTKVLVTYEPVWAISTTIGSEPDTPANTLEAIKIISDFLSTHSPRFDRPEQFSPGFTAEGLTVEGLPTTHFLYGGSVNQDNIANFLKHSELSGAVIGSASIRKEEFAKILEIISGL